MEILRAHSYEPIEGIRNELDVVPIRWRELVSHIPFIVLPDDLSPVWIGLMREERETHVNGVMYSEVGAWACSTEGYDANWRWQPHLYFKESAISATVHEIGHALEEAWHVDVSKFYDPDTAFYDYMASNEAEYFACAVRAFLTPCGDDIHWNNFDLAERNYDLWLFLREMDCG